jgi:hypothetical protein
MAVHGISFSGAGIRVGLALALVLGSFNPSGYSAYHWLAAPPLAFTPGKVLVGVVLVIGWLMCLRTAFVALGWLGMLLGAILLGTTMWFLIDRQIISVAGAGIVWVSLLVLGLLLGVGLSWSLIRARATGQLEVQ